MLICNYKFQVLNIVKWSEVKYSTRAARTHTHLADNLSRAYLPTTAHPTGIEFEHINATAFLPVSTWRLHEIQQATENDDALRILKNVILYGWPEHRGQVPSQITPYFSMRDELAIHDRDFFVDNESSLLSAYDMTWSESYMHHTSVQNPFYAEHGKPSFGPVWTPK